MWLLSTSRAELKFFHSPSSVTSPGFAILSHTWGDNEQTFQDLQGIRERCKSSGENPRDLVSEKIRKCCELAEAEGYAWAWVVTCCIDKTSSAELTEAINSMYRYYQLSGVCLVYLEDVYNLSPVPSRNRFYGPTPMEVGPLEECRWGRRGWTLQELIAPRFVVLLSSTWQVLGSKIELSVELSKATGIPAGLLRLEQSLDDFSIAQRMSWASKRETTREEDEAYCLLGIFGIYMPTLYGEGRNAFRRLQEEIMRTHPDATLFAWGEPVPLRKMKEDTEEIYHPLLARSAKDYERSWDVTHSLRRNSSVSGDNPSFAITPYGVRARVPLAQVEGCTLMDLCWTKSDGHGSEPLFLRLRAETASGISGQYLVSGGKRTNSRLCICDKAASKKITWKMTEICLVSPPSESSCLVSENSPSRYLLDRSLSSPFHLYAPSDDISHSYTVQAIKTSNPGLTYILSVSVKNSLWPTRKVTGLMAHVLLGKCMRGTTQPSGSGTQAPTIHWARAHWVTTPSLPCVDDVSNHVCDEDHIDQWPHYTRTVLPELRTRGTPSPTKICGSMSLRFTQSVFSKNTKILQTISFQPQDLITKNLTSNETKPLRSKAAPHPPPPPPKPRGQSSVV